MITDYKCFFYECKKCLTFYKCLTNVFEYILITFDYIVMKWK